MKKDPRPDNDLRRFGRWVYSWPDGCSYIVLVVLVVFLVKMLFFP